jgi:predicted N-formylglutamate amidohydrolase
VTSARAKQDVRLVLSCEHGGNRVPAEYDELFRGAEDVLESHRGWDPGALDLARRLAKSFDLPLPAVTWCRLLVESNRAPTNPRIWSTYTKHLPRTEKNRILERYWWPHRRDVEALIGKHLTAGARVLHVAVHSFTPVIDGVERNADIGLLYDSRRAAEGALCKRWQQLLQTADGGVRVRRNFPYIGATDGFPTWLRRRHSKGRYAGIELEVNQGYFDKAGVPAVHRLVARTLTELLAAA